jgi:branched-chain amino acid transport system permease protein
VASLDTLLFLGIDGLTSGAVYALLGLGIVLIYLVTRVINIAHGDFAMLAAMTLVSLEQGLLPGTSYLLGAGALLWGALSALAARRQGAWAIARPCLGALATAALAFALPLALAALRAPAALNAAAAVLMVSALGPMFHRLAIEPIARASVLVYIIVTLGMHLILQGLALQLWGPQAHSVAPLLDGSLAIGAVVISHQSLLVLGLTVLLVVALYLGFNHTLAGTALRACAVNRTGADLCGIEVASAGRRAFGLGAGLAAVAGVLIAPVVGVHYEMGFLIGLKGFVGATLGGLVSYPGAIVGGVLIGGFESVFSYLSSAYRDALVFLLIIPILLLQTARHKRRGVVHGH